MNEHPNDRWIAFQREQFAKNPHLSAYYHLLGGTVTGFEKNENAVGGDQFNIIVHCPDGFKRRVCFVLAEAPTIQMAKL